MNPLIFHSVVRDLDISFERLINHNKRVLYSPKTLQGYTNTCTEAENKKEDCDKTDIESSL